MSPTHIIVSVYAEKLLSRLSKVKVEDDDTNDHLSQSRADGANRESASTMGLKADFETYNSSSRNMTEA